MPSSIGESVIASPNGASRSLKSVQGQAGACARAMAGAPKVSAMTAATVAIRRRATLCVVVRGGLEALSAFRAETSTFLLLRIRPVIGSSDTRSAQIDWHEDPDLRLGGYSWP